MPEQPEEKKSFGWNILHEDMVFAHALCKLPIGGVMKYTFYHNARDLVFPPDCHKVANINTLIAKPVPAGAKLVLFGRYIVNFYVGIE
jgi:hypothetical protein